MTSYALDQIAASVAPPSATSRHRPSVAAVSRHPAVQCCYRVTGPTLLTMIVRVADNHALTRLLEEFTHFGDTKTAVILSAECENRFHFARGYDAPGP